MTAVSLERVLEVLSTDEMDSIAALAHQTAVAAGELLMHERPSDNELQVATKTTPSDVVTEMDEASEAVITSLIRTFRPADSIVGEEGGSTVGASPVRWVIDPLDGTVNYLYRIPCWAVSIGVQVNLDGQWHSVVGVVHSPALTSTWHARIGAGAFLDDADGQERLKVSGQTQLSQALLATGFGYDARRREEQGRTVAHMVPRCRDIRRAGAAAVDLCWVADGRLDGYWERGIKLWDHAAASLVVSEAGGIVTDLHGGVPGPDVVIAANAGLWPDLVAELVAADVLGSGI
jgi:myo-inositol-1(or 4)-monophosphatase